MIELRRAGTRGNGAQLMTPEQYYTEQVQLTDCFFHKYAVYRHLRGLGWVVTEGLPFAVDFRKRLFLPLSRQ